jgi:dUTP pyrophosphatase
MALTIKYKKDPDAKAPSYAYDGDAGLDIFSNEEKIIEPHHRATIKTGLYFEIPNNYAGLVWDKSGLALKQGIHTMSGVLDSNYRGELKVVLVNLSSQARKIEKSVKVAQLLIQKVENALLKEVSELSETERGQGGFGSSGLGYNPVLTESEDNTENKKNKKDKDDFISEIKEEIEKPKSKSKRKKIAMKRGLKEIKAKIKR